MFKMVMTFPASTTQTAKRPRACPYCHSPILQRWGRASKPLLDLQTHQMNIYRYRCSDCQRTFRAYPPGVDRVSRSQRLRALAAITWALGLSLDSVVGVFHNLGIELSRTTIWRDGQRIARYVHGQDATRAVTFLGEQKGSRRKPFIKDEITLILQIGTVRLAMGIVDEQGPYAAKKWLETLAGEVGLEVTVETMQNSILN